MAAQLNAAAGEKTNSRAEDAEEDEVEILEVEVDTKAANPEIRAS